MSDLLDQGLELRDQVVERGDVLVALDPQPLELVGQLGLLGLERRDAVEQRLLAGLRPRGGGPAARAERRRSSASASWASSSLI